MPWPKGVPQSAEHRRKNSEALKGRKKPPFSASQRAGCRQRALGNRYVLDAPIKGECAYCFKPATTHDHVIPRRRGGLDVPENVVLCCRWCNGSKKSRTPEEWWAWLTRD